MEGAVQSDSCITEQTREETLEACKAVAKFMLRRRMEMKLLKVQIIARQERWE